MPLFYDYTYILLIPAILLSLYAQAKVQTTFSKYLKVPARSSITGAQAAKELLYQNQIYDVRIEPVNGRLSDHYDPQSKTLRLSQEVYGAGSLASLGIAAHEVGHAIQHDNGYVPLKLRNAIVPIANIGSQLAFPLLLLGLILSIPSLVQVGIFAFSLAVLFQLITLPVEYNASSRAIAALESSGMIQGSEIQSTRKILSAAALTYVAATLMSVLQLLRLIVLAGDRRQNRR